jgi:hypothetical protein
MMLALAVSGNNLAQKFFLANGGSDYWAIVLPILERKINTYEAWDKKFPAFGGYIPWVFVDDNGMRSTTGWDNQTPALDNGENIWGIYALVEAFRMAAENPSTPSQHIPQIKSLIIRYQAWLDLMARTGLTIFYNGNGYHRSVATITNTTAQPTSPSNYGMNCNPNAPNTFCFLADPYEGETFTWFMDLYGDWSFAANATAEKEKVWINKREFLRTNEFQTPQGPITVQRGWWFSSHEQWKYLELPYMDVPVNRELFMNGEKARTWNSVLKHIPGLYASVNDVVTVPGNLPPDYVSATGIQPISFQQVRRTDVVTPYGSYPTMLADLPAGLAWYNTMLNGPAMQGPYGSTEGININATAIAPLVTWDTKITTVVAMLGGVSHLTTRGLKRDGKYERFVQVVQREWTRAYPSIKGRSATVQPPVATFPASPKIQDFTTCTASSR